MINAEEVPRFESPASVLTCSSLHRGEPALQNARGVVHDVGAATRALEFDTRRPGHPVMISAETDRPVSGALVDKGKPH